MAVLGARFGQRLKTHDNIAYIAYKIILISVLAMAARAPGTTHNRHFDNDKKPLLTLPTL